MAATFGLLLTIPRAVPPDEILVVRIGDGRDLGAAVLKLAREQLVAVRSLSSPLDSGVG
jgi:hypothetical protein